MYYIVHILIKTSSLKKLPTTKFGDSFVRYLFGPKFFARPLVILEKYTPQLKQAQAKSLDFFYAKSPGWPLCTTKILLCLLKSQIVCGDNWEKDSLSVCLILKLGPQEAVVSCGI